METRIDCVVSPVDQTFPVVADDVSVMEVPGQNVLGPLMIGVAGAAFTATLNGMVVAEHPAALVTVNVYAPPAETMIDCVVAPVDQRFPVAEDDVNVVEPPAQKELTPLMTGVGGAALSVTAKAAEVAEQPPALVAVTVKEPAAETVIDCVVAPVDQRFPVADEEVRVIVLPLQSVAGPLITGVAGSGFAVTA